MPASVKVTVQPKLLQWARERAALAPNELAEKIKLKEDRVTEWERTGELELRHLERVAQKTNTPVGYLFLPEPPVEVLPVADYRRIAGTLEARPSPELIDTLNTCLLRQDWYREFRISEGEDALDFVGSATVQHPVSSVAEQIRELLQLYEHSNATFTTWEQALENLYNRVEDIGVLTMRNGVVGNNSHRKLRISEFRGFTLSDNYAPLIFVNAADSKSAQMFTVCHELVHVMLGESAVSDADPTTDVPVERFANAVAAEVLVPTEEFVANWSRRNDPAAEAQRLARHFKVSVLVILIRARDADVLPRVVFDELYDTEYQRAAERASSSGGNFYHTQGSRLGHLFPRAVLASAYEGKTSYSQAYQLLGVRKAETFNGLARKYGIIF
jgi:Zn-dependent peptidase ImmA (M78 family)